jgi:anti-anti-sigma regulatory factor
MQNQGWYRPCSYEIQNLEEVMLSVRIDTIGEMAVVECEGRIEQIDDAFILRDAVTAQRDARTIVLDLSEVTAIEGGSLGMLVFLKRWAQDYDIRFKLFNPSKFVRNRLTKASPISEFDIPSLDEMMVLLARSDRRYELAA